MAPTPRAPRTTAAERHATRGTAAPQPADRLAVGEQPPAWVTLAAGAERLSLCDRTLRRAIAAGELRGYKFGKALRVRLDDLDRWAESKAMPNARTLTKARVSVR